jgi:chemotaxis protein CheZ
MAIKRKIFRIEELNPVGTPIAKHAAAGLAQREILDILTEVRALRDVVESWSNSPSKAIAGIEPNGLRQLKDETDTIHRSILHTKQEVATLHAGAFSNGKPRATRELDAVVDGTERATQQILDAAEVIEEAAKLLAASVKQGQEQALAQDIQDHVLRIFEACNFQDLSGQRIAKVLATLQFVEDRIKRMIEIWGGAEALRDYAAPIKPESVPHLLHGPKLDGDAGHVSQDDIDAMFNSG